ncbi:MAG TPA: EamA family transporter [Terriglobales bacterium]|nr:EamA family transporter [Terriglobales bacterium]
MTFYLPIVLTVLATTVYHIAQKSVPSQVNPMLSLCANYATALAISLVLLPFYPSRQGAFASWRSLNWSSYVVGVAIFGVELSVLLAYRVGWRISIASAASNVMTAVLLAAIGLAFFREHLSRRNWLGVAFCLAGLALIVER